ncbi:MAG: sel1 repeat family protein, partial [Burkholderiaceae bacterium]|nr:sel1 repeat family protein [Burkholderiaceae bacterium]
MTAISVRWTLALLALLLAAGVAIAANGLQPAADDVDLANGWAAYQAMDYAKALALYRKAAERGQRVAQFNLAVMLITGEGAPADPKQGIAWLRKSADNGMARAQYSLGVFYERGEHVPRSLAEATAWFLKAAEQGWRDAQVSVATQYFLGRGA